MATRNHDPDSIIKFLRPDIPARPGTKLHAGYMAPKKLEGQNYRTFRDVVGSKPRRPNKDDRAFSPADTIRHAIDNGYAELVSTGEPHRSPDVTVAIEAEKLLRFELWGELNREDINNIPPKLLRDKGIYGGAQGIWVDKERTKSISENERGVSSDEFEQAVRDMRQPVDTRQGTPNLTNFEKQLTDLVGRPTETRPFVCDGSPLECQVFLVGYNPATHMSSDFWDFWTEQGFDRTLWYAEYLRERATRPLKPGKTRRQKASPTRRMMDKVIEGAGIPILETNLYAHPTVDAKSLKHKDRRPFDFLLDTIQPKVIITHGDDAKQAMAETLTSAKVINVAHLSRGWSFARALSLGRDIKNLVA